MRIFGLSLALLTTPLYAFEGNIAIDYKTTFLGMTIATGEARSNFGKGEYTTTLEAKSGGVGKMFSGGWLNLKAEGVIAPDKVASKLFNLVVKNKNGIETLTYDVVKNRVTNLDIKPFKEPHPNIEKITDAHLTNITDPSLGSVLVIAGKGDLLSPASCNNKTQKVFDGRLRYDITFTFQHLEPISIDGYTGEAMKCKVHFNFLAGYRTDKPFVKQNESVPVEAWFIPIKNTRFLVPVRVDVHTKFGLGRLSAGRISSDVKNF